MAPALLAPSRLFLRAVSPAAAIPQCPATYAALHTFKPVRPFKIPGNLIPELLSRPSKLKLKEEMPPYPYADSETQITTYDRGLYGGLRIQSGNKISKGRNKGKTRRKWYPNVRLETIRSEALGKNLQIPITARCMRTIRKCGGLDQYLTGNTAARIKELGKLGWRLRWEVLNTPMMKAKFVEESDRLGLPEGTLNPVNMTFDRVWNDVEVRENLLQEQESEWQKLRERDERFVQHVKTRWAPADGEEYEQLGKTMATLQLSSPVPGLLAERSRGLPVEA